MPVLARLAAGALAGSTLVALAPAADTKFRLQGGVADPASRPIAGGRGREPAAVSGAALL